MFLKLFLISLPIFVVLDLLWLGVIARDFYQKHIGVLLRPDVNWAAALAFYFVFLAGTVFFVISPAVEKNSWTQAFWWGASFGLIAYATYDLTNLATLKGWSLVLTCVDIAWGGIIVAAVSTATYFIYTKLG